MADEIGIYSIISTEPISGMPGHSTTINPDIRSSRLSTFKGIDTSSSSLYFSCESLFYS
jgi:hypothetical protein